MMIPEKKFHGKTRNNYAQNVTGHHLRVRATKDQIDERRNRIYKLKLQGYTEQEIADELKISISTVEKDVHHMKYFCVKWSKDIISASTTKPLVDSYTQIEIVQKELWNLYRAEKQIKTKKRILDAIIANALKKDNLVKYRRLR
ncbi:MAG: hypothetical protein HZC29_06160, partial [Thaumarchaeota archaeon]|nr:hypothetical protein [Nitrososphaerota archaeon]